MELSDGHCVIKRNRKPLAPKGQNVTTTINGILCGAGLRSVFSPRLKNFESVRDSQVPGAGGQLAGRATARLARVNLPDSPVPWQSHPDRHVPEN